MQFMRFMVGRHPILSGIMGMALAMLIYFGARFGSDAMYFADPAHQEQDLAMWMSPRYVGKSWGLPPEVIGRIMHLQPDHAHMTLKEVTAEMGITLADLQSRVEDARKLGDALRVLRRHHD
jgi:hypothetical protein